MRGFSLVELMIVILIFSTILGATYSFLSMSRSSYETGDIQVAVQQEVRKAMDKIARELREANSVNLGNEYPFTIWGEKIKFTVTDGQLQRIAQGQPPTVIANNIQNIQFSLSGGDVIYITVTSQKNTLLGRTLTANLTSQVTLRN